MVGSTISNGTQRSSRRSALWRFALSLGAVLLASPVASASSTTSAQSLRDVLDALRAEGMPIIYSSRLVRPDMLARSDHAGGTEVPRLRSLSQRSRARLESELAPHGLTIEEGPGGVLLVVHSRKLRRAARRRLRQAQVEPGPTLAEGGADSSPTLTVHETINVVRERREEVIQSGLTYDQAELSSLPALGDPWNLASHVPGVLSDRIDVGGSEREQQATLSAPAASHGDNAFFIDGVETTDMVSAGKSTIFFDLDQVESIEISTGGTDVTTIAAGVAMRLVTKRGGGEPRGSLRGNRSVGSSRRQPDSEVNGQTIVGNRTRGLEEIGFEIGGPMIADRLFGWGAFSTTDIQANATGGLEDDTRLEHTILKINAQPNRRDSLVASLVYSDKTKPTRGAGPSRTLESTRRQGTPSRAVKLEHSHLFGNQTSLTSHLSRLDTDFTLVGRGGQGPDAAETFIGPDGVQRANANTYSSDRDADRAEISIDHFARAGKSDHTLRFGASHRQFQSRSEFSWPGPRLARRFACEAVRLCPPGNETSNQPTIGLIEFYRDLTSSAALDYQAVWAQDTIQLDRLTASIGLRWDGQQGRVLPGQAPANPFVPEVLPAVTTQGTDGGFDWSTVSPRLGIARTFGANQRTTMRLSFARFAGQLANTHVLRLDPLFDVSATYLFDDRNGDRDLQDNESLVPFTTFGINLLNPLAIGSPNQTDPDLRPEMTDEVNLAAEREVGNHWSIGGNVTWRRVHDIHEERLLVFDNGFVRPAERVDFVPGGQFEAPVPEVGNRQIDLFVLRPGLARTGGTLLTNGERERTYLGATLSLTRRLGKRWMMRAHFNVGEARWNVPQSFLDGQDPSDFAGAGDRDDELFADPAINDRSGSVFLQSTWSANIDALVRIAPNRKWGFDLSGNLFARQGYPVPYFASLFFPAESLVRTLQATESVDEFRTDDLLLTDLRVSKEMTLSSKIAATVSVDVYNVFDSDAVLDRGLNVFSSLAGAAEQTVAARTFRFGLRLSWR